MIAPGVASVILNMAFRLNEPPLGVMVGAAVNRGTAVKFASNVRLALAVKLKFAEVETTVPFSVQLAKAKFGLGVAMRLTFEPLLYRPAPVMLPPPAGVTLAAIVYAGVQANSMASMPMDSAF